MGFLTWVTLRLSAISELLKFHKLFPRVSFPLSCKEKTKKKANTFVCVTLSSLNKLYSLILPERKTCFFWFLIGLILLKFKFFFYLDSFGDRPFFWMIGEHPGTSRIGSKNIIKSPPKTIFLFSTSSTLSKTLHKLETIYNRVFCKNS